MTGYLRYPHVNGDTLTFVADDDVWLAEVSGGRASRLSCDHVPVRTPFLSRDGACVAFASRAGGGWDLYVHSAAGVERLTWLSATQLTVCGWFDEDRIVIASNHASGHRGLSYLYLAAPDGSMERLPYGPGMSVAFGPGGAVAVTTPNSLDAAGWKRYRGGTASQLWLDPHGEGAWRRVLPGESAGLYHGTWYRDRLMFWSDLGAGPREQAQLYSVDATGSDMRRHTGHTFEQGYVRNPTTDGTTIVYHARGVLYRMAGLDAKPEPIEIDLGLGAPRPVAVPPTERLGAFVPDHGGDASVLEWRGAAYLLTHRSGPARALSEAPGVRIREPQLLGRTGRAVWVTDAEGEDALEIAPLGAGADPTRLASGGLGRVLHLLPSPDGGTIAVVSHDGRVSLVDPGTGDVRELGRSLEGEATGLAFSPDGRYLVWCSPVSGTGMVRQLMCADLGLGHAPVLPLTRGQFSDWSPAFSHDGKYLMFLSNRTFDPSYDDFGFDLGFRGSARPWLVPLGAGEPAPFGPAADGWPLSDPAGEPDGQGDRQPACVFDLSGVEDRMVPFPVPAGHYRSLCAAHGGVVWSRGRAAGVLGTGRAGVEGPAPKDEIEYFSFGQRRASVVAEADSFAVSGDGKRIVVRADDEVWVQAVHEKPSPDDPAAKVVVDLSRLRCQIRPRDEWRQMFDENGRIMRDHFWREDFSGVDWPGVLAQYRTIVERLATRDDLVDLLWETVGELNTSHACAVPPDSPSATAVGKLGAVVSRTATGEFVIDEVLPGESSDPRARCPLRAAGIAAEPGTRVVAVDGRLASGVPDLGALLVGTVGKVTELTLERDGRQRRVAVIPVADETRMRYHQWVASRVAYVDDRSGARLGYVHIPDMKSEGWAEFHRLIERASAREGLIVDVRFNGGGHTSELVLERIGRKVLGWSWARHIVSARPYPHQAVRGPVVVVTNAYAGSDGDIIAAAVQTAGLGPVVGQRSWGGVVGIDGRFDLVDGTRITQPRYAFAFAKQGFGIENHGVDPDIVVEWGPAEWEAEADSQLDRAIEEALTRLRQTPAATPPSFEPPRFA